MPIRSNAKSVRYISGSSEPENEKAVLRLAFKEFLKRQ